MMMTIIIIFSFSSRRRLNSTISSFSCLHEKSEWARERERARFTTPLFAWNEANEETSKQNMNDYWNRQITAASPPPFDGSQRQKLQMLNLLFRIFIVNICRILLASKQQQRTTTPITLLRMLCMKFGTGFVFRSSPAFLVADAYSPSRNVKSNKMHHSKQTTHTHTNSPNEWCEAKKKNEQPRQRMARTPRKKKHIDARERARAC